MKAWLAGLAAGLVFGLGLALGGMLEPLRIVGFLDFFGRWDPTLAFVMAGALAVALPATLLVRQRSRPLLAARFEPPPARGVTLPLVAGSALFGVGWALAGYCPGPALTNLATGSPRALLFVGAMTLGVLTWELLRKRRGAPVRSSP